MRFSLRTLLIALTCCAVGCALLFAAPSYVAVPALIFLNVAVPAVLTAGVVYGCGTWRAFCIGGLFPSSLTLYTIGWMLGLSFFEGPGDVYSPDSWRDFAEDISATCRIYAGVSWAMTIVVGLIVVLVRKMAIRSNT